MGSTKKASLQGQVDLEGTEDGSGGYNDFSDESLGEDTANVSDFEDGNPKDAPHVCFFEKDACRKIFQLRGDAKQGIERVCGGSAATCIRNGHRDEDRPVGPPGIYEVIATDRKVDGILSAHQTKEACVKTRAAWDDLHDLQVQAMSPPGVDYERSKLLAGAALDAVQLPGMCNTGMDNDPGSVAEAIDVQGKAANQTSSLPD
jgi:hypothetical protein